MSQVQKSKQASKTEAETTSEASKYDDTTAASTEDMMAEIDALIEEVGEEFAMNYKQKGGQ